MTLAPPWPMMRASFSYLRRRVAKDDGGETAGSQSRPSCFTRSPRAPRRRGRAASRGCSRPRAPRPCAARATAQRDASSRKPASVTFIPASGSVLVRVEAGGDEHELGLEALDRRRDGVVERAQVLLVSGARRHRHVERRLALLLRAAGAGVERPLVQRDEEHGVVVPEDVLRPVAVVDVEVDDRDALGAVRLRGARGDRRRC